MTEVSRDLTPPVAPTVTSNMQAASMACAHERRRVLDILAGAASPVDPRLIAAIEAGTPAAIQRTNQRLGHPDAAEQPNGRPTASGWGAITERINSRRRATRDASTERDT